MRSSKLALAVCAAALFVAGTAAEHVRRAPASAVPSPDSRLTSYPGKRAIPCPHQTAHTAVIFAFGQSNASNNGGQRYSAVNDHVVNYFAGQCYVASSPLLGAQGTLGESWTLLGNKLVASGRVDQAVIISSGIGNTSIAQWAEGGNLNAMLREIAGDAAKRFKVTAVLFHQGEADFLAKTGRSDYAARLRSVVATVHAAGISAPIYIARASYHGRDAERWTADNPVTEAQDDVTDGKTILPGPDTDALMGPLDRYDGTHFSGSGEEKFAAAWAAILAH